MKKTSLTILTIVLLVSFISFAKAPPKKIPNNADISLNGVFLRNPESSVKVLGKKIKIVDEDSGPNFSAYNKDKGQIAKFVIFEGDNANSFSLFNVKYVQKSGKRKLLALSEIDKFISGKNIRLGMTRKDLVNILDSNFKTARNGDILTLRYQIGDSDKTGFLQHYNMPLYSSEYKFKNDKLTEFSFGFEMP
jgi:hypothetical protein